MKHIDYFNRLVLNLSEFYTPSVALDLAHELYYLVSPEERPSGDSEELFNTP